MTRRILLILSSLVVLAAVSIGSRVHDVDDGLTTRSFTLVYSMTITHETQQNEKLDVWIPLPIADSFQDVPKYEVNSPLSYELFLDPEYGNNILHFSSNGSISKRLDFKISMEIRRIEQHAWKREKNSYPASKQDLQRFLAPDSLVPIDGPIAEEANRVVARSGASTPLEKAEVIYRHLVKTMSYDKSGVGWGHGDALYACDVRAGNCTDIHSLFIGMTRSQNIPSRFIMGFPLADTADTVSVPGYHCWAEFYVDDYGWVPVDISEAIKYPEKDDYYFGRIDANRVAFTIGRDISIESSLDGQKMNYFIYPYALLDNEPLPQVSYNFKSVLNQRE